MSRSSCVMPSGYRSRVASRSHRWAGVVYTASSRSSSERRRRSASALTGISRAYTRNQSPGRRTAPHALLRSMRPATVSKTPASRGLPARAHAACQTHQADDRKQRASTDAPADPPAARRPGEPRGTVPAGWADGRAPQHQGPPTRSLSHRSLLQPRLRAACPQSYACALLRKAPLFRAEMGLR